MASPNIYFIEPYGCLDLPKRQLRAAVETAKGRARAISAPCYIRKIDGKTLLPSIVRTVFPDGTVKLGEVS